MKAGILALALLLAMPLAAQVADGDAHWAKRAEGAKGGHARAEQVDAAIAAYQRAIAHDRADLEAHARLLRAYRFKGAYVATSNVQKRQIYATAKQAGERALAAVAAQLAARGVKADAPAQDVGVAIRALPGAAAVYLWDSVNWGEWALAYGKLAAARQGAADRIRREATIAMIANPALELGAPARVLGRLHDQTPHIPFITGWASTKEAVRFLTESLKYDPDNKLTLVFLAEALVDYNRHENAHAIQLLRTAIAAPLNAQYLVEDAAAVEDAKRLLARYGG